MMPNPYERVKRSIWDTDGSLEHIFDNNKKWVDKVNKEEPGIFAALKDAQAPKYLYIGCSDSRYDGCTVSMFMCAGVVCST